MPGKRPDLQAASYSGFSLCGLKKNLFPDENLVKILVLPRAALDAVGKNLIE